MKRFLPLVLTLALSSNLMLAQESYIEHKVEKDETIYKISRHYGVSINSILALNPGSKDNIYVGSTLRIPNSEQTTTTTTPIITQEKVLNYKVQHGNTKFSLARQFGISINYLEQQNPHIKPMLQAGHIINIDKSIPEQIPPLKPGEHRVAKDETLWRIAYNHGISLAQLKAANTHQLTEHLEIGQILTIPEKDAKFSIPGQYVVKHGDTKYSLAKRFNFSIAELENKNPHIVPTLMAGQTLNVDINHTVTTKVKNNNNNTLKPTKVSEAVAATEQPTTVTANKQETTSAPKDSLYKNYVIEPKQTLYGLSQMAGMTIEEFTELNPKLKTSFTVGDIIKMPLKSSAVSTTTSALSTAPKNQNTTPVAVSSPTKISLPSTAKGTSNNKALIDNLVTDSSNGIYFYTPFSKDELSALDQRQKMLEKNKDYQKYVDFFQGAQIAIDSAKALNLDIEISLLKKNSAKRDINIESTHQKNALLVPFLESDNYFTSITSNQELSLIGIQSNLGLNPNIKTYESVPSSLIQKTKTLNYLAQQKAKVIVVSDLNEATNKDLILKIIPDATFLKADSTGFFNAKTLEKALDKKQLNYIIFDSKKTIVLLNTTTILLGQLSDHDIELVMIESDLLSNLNEVSEMRYRILKLIYPTSFSAENETAVKEFEKRYLNTFDTKPTEQAILGFDVTLDVLLRIAQNTSFENTIKTINSTQPHQKFNYQKLKEGFYSNTEIYLMQYNSDKGVKIID